MLYPLNMSSDKPRVMFRADRDVHEYIESMPSGVRSVRINEIIRQHIEQDSDIENRVARLEKDVKSLKKSIN